MLFVKLKKYALISCSFALGILSFNTVFAVAGGSVQLFADKITNIRSYQANFEQSVQNENGREIDYSEGEFFIQKPNHFRWEVTEAFQQTIIADGSHIFTYDPELEQVTIQNQSKLLTDSPLLLLTSNAKQLAESFMIDKINLTDQPDKALFILKPKQESSIFESVHVLFKGGKIEELLMRDSLGQQTTVKFLNIKLNKKINVSLFNFKIPEGVDVIDSREKLTN